MSLAEPLPYPRRPRSRRLLRALRRALLLIVAVLNGGTNPGGATIDQQLAKQLYGNGAGLGGTLRQIGLGIRLGMRWSHHQLLAMYLNVDYYGHGFWGVRQASEGYFRTAPSRLSWAQAAMLAGLLQAPSAYDPLTHPGVARERREHVLDQLVANGKLTAGQARRASATAPVAR